MNKPINAESLNQMIIHLGTLLMVRNKEIFFWETKGIDKPKSGT